MTPTSVLPAVPPVGEVLGTCGACPHPLAAHDAISLRFCRATTASIEASTVDTTTRGCVCPSS
jgi:hypothetical protein